MPEVAEEEEEEEIDSWVIAPKLNPAFYLIN